MDLEHLEALALADDRAAALAGLLPGTVEHDYWRGVHLQHAGRLDEVDELLAGWARRHGRHDEHHTRLARRQLLLRAAADPAGHADAIRFEAGVWLSDEAEAAVAAQRHPTRLDPALLDEDALIADALGRAGDLAQVTDDALGALAARHAALSGSQRRALLQRLVLAGAPGALDAVAADLDDKASRGFGGQPIHARLTRAQLEELARRRPALRDAPAWVDAVLTRLRPPAHVDWVTDLDARAAYLDALWAFVEPLAPTFNALKAQVLYHRLDLDRRRGAVDRARLLRYLALPRRVGYASELLGRAPAAHQAAMNSDAARAAGLPPVPDDEPLVRELLEHLIATRDGADLAAHVRADWLDALRAEVRLLSGDPDPERWAAVLGPTRLAALRDRVELTLTARNPDRWPAGAEVALEVDVKHVPELRVKVFRIDPVAYFLARGAEVDTSIDLDGMVARDEQVIASALPPIRRERRRIPLPACARPGTYVVELIGNGRSSRALIRVGGLRHTVRVGAGGPTVRVLDEAGRPVDGARLWLGGRELAPRDDGAITIPFSTAPGHVPVLLVHGDVAQREVIAHPAETYRFTAGLHLERESVIAGRVARLLVRPRLTVAGWPAPVSLVEHATLAITVTDLAGTSATRAQPVELRDDAETVVELHVPEQASHLEVVVRGRVRVVSTQQTIDVSDADDAPVNGVLDQPAIAVAHLATTAGGHVVSLLGRTGEPLAGRPVALALAHEAVRFEVTTTLETDARGRIELGAPAGLVAITASPPGSPPRRWPVRAAVEPPPRVHVVEGAPVVLAAPPGLAAALARVDDARAAVWLVELRGGAPARDVTGAVAIDGAALRIDGLAAGDYLLVARGLARPVAIAVAPGGAIVADGWASAGPRALELSPPAPVFRALAAADDAVVARLAGAGPRTRVHVIATRFRPDRALPRGLADAPRPPDDARVEPVASHYVSGRDLGDEYRYVLDRRGAPRRPGVLLDKPGLLLNPWARRTTSTGVHDAAAGGAYGASPPRPAAAPAPPRARPAAAAGLTPADALPCLDFLAGPATVLANLRPDAAGEVRVARRELGAAQHVRVIAVDPAGTAEVDLPLDETALAARDLRLRLAIDPARHVAEERRIEAAPAGARLVVEDVRSGKLELVDTVARAHQVLATLAEDDDADPVHDTAAALRELAFLGRWHALDEAERREHYGRHASHELHLFLHRKDPAWFERVIRPYLAHRRDKTFVDRWLLGEDLRGFLAPWAFGRLGALERVLLARALPDVAPAVARLLGEAVELIPPDPERDARLVDTLLGAAALEGGGAAGAAASIAREQLALEDADEEVVSRGGGAMAKRAAPRARKADTIAGAFAAEAEPMELAASFAAPGGPPPAAAPVAGAPPPGPYDARLAGDLRERERAEPLYRAADTTQEWAEASWWRVRVEDESPARIPPSRFWLDLARHAGDGPFLSPHLGACATSVSAAVAALAFLDLPFEAGAHAVEVEDTRLTVTCASPALAARTRLAEVAPPADPAPILVGQSLFRADDRWEWDGPERREKYVTGELLAGVVYQCQVVVTNPTSASQRLAVLLQVPRGAIPVAGGAFTRTVHAHLPPYGTHAVEYAFYLPEPGTWPHFPAHVTRGGELVAWAPARELVVVREPTAADTGSWAHVSQHGTTDDVLAFLGGANPGRIELERIAWRMREPDAFRRITAALAARHVYHDRLWAYALAHGDGARLAEWLAHQDDLVAPAGPVLEGGAVALDPVARGWYQHLEYAPLVNARAHQLGARRRILDDALDAQWRALLEIVAHRARPTADDLLAAAHYLFALDRIDEALAALDRVDPGAIASRLPYAYLAAYAACGRGDLAAARRHAAPWLDLPVDRWRHRFAALIAMLDEAEGGGAAAAVDPDSRDQRLAEAAARQPALALAVEGDQLVLQHHRVAGCQLRFYRMDLELLFSRQPFVQGDVERFAWIEPGEVIEVPLAGDGRTAVPIPAALQGVSAVVEARAPGLRRAVAHYAHDLAVELTEAYGQLRVRRASSQEALSATYVKVYARHRGGAVRFYKDGYTDLRGRFDYATLSTDDLDRVERFALLVASDAAGATVLEAAPPPR